MKFRTLTMIAAMTLFAATAISVQLSAQELQQHLSGAHSRAVTTFNAPRAAKGSGLGMSPLVNKADGAIPEYYQNAKNVDNGVLAPADGAFTIFEVPGEGRGYDQGSYPIDINAAGDITGFYVDTWNVYHGFWLTAGGNFTEFTVPGAGTGFHQGTIPQGMNDKGDITGYYITSDNVARGFMRNTSGAFTKFHAPGAGRTPGLPGADVDQGTFGTNISDAGVISGYFVNGNYEFRGFVRYTDCSITIFDAPGAGGFAGQGTTVVRHGMTANGAITGTYFDADFGTHGYLRAPGGSTFPTFDVYGALLTVGGGITPKETITGYSLDVSLVFHSYLRHRNGTFTQFNDPNAGLYFAQGTEAFAINPANWVTGQYVDENYVLHGFMRSSRGVFTTIDVSGASTFPQAINPAGAIVGYFFDQNGAALGFVYTAWTP